MIASTDMIVRIAVAVGLGAILGLERSLAGKGAGMRTYAMVALSASVFSIISETIVASGINASATSDVYIPAAIITGIGFLGAGLIIFQSERHRVTGLTTAAGLWVAAGVGIASGFRLFDLAVIETIAGLLIFTVLWFLEHQIDRFSYRKDKSDEHMPG